MMAPLQIASFFPENDWIRPMQDWLGLQTWYSLAVYVVLILLFTFFYTKMQINPEKIAENLGKSGAYIPSVRPGKETEDYINRVLSRITQKPFGGAKNTVGFCGHRTVLAVRAIPSLCSSVLLCFHRD